jgi:hypothetical protein
MVNVVGGVGFELGRWRSALQCRVGFVLSSGAKLQLRSDRIGSDMIEDVCSCVASVVRGRNDSEAGPEDGQGVWK